eukprot:m.31554 g.31554  ORF g.31554 m.31554 type:complete len:76 (+) comp12333_c0_seq1:614-841(+)
MPDAAIMGDDAAEVSRAPQEDCFECKVVGTGAMVGLAGYVAYHRQQIPLNQPRSRLFSAVVTFGLLGIGLVRTLK